MRVIVWLAKPGAKVIVSPATAVAIAALNEPGPLSLLLVTAIVAKSPW